VEESRFELGESSFVEAGGQALPEVGTMNYQIKLKEFVPEGLLKAAARTKAEHGSLGFPSLHVRSVPSPG
jgi:hypothetical protein